MDEREEARQLIKRIEGLGLGDATIGDMVDEIGRLRSQEVLSNDIVLKAINDEPEYPGEMPDELWKALKKAILTDDKDLILFAFRQTVKDTKNGIIGRLR